MMVGKKRKAQDAKEGGGSGLKGKGVHLLRGKLAGQKGSEKDRARALVW